MCRFWLWFCFAIGYHHHHSFVLVATFCDALCHDEPTVWLAFLVRRHNMNIFFLRLRASPRWDTKLIPTAFGFFFFVHCSHCFYVFRKISIDSAADIYLNGDRRSAFFFTKPNYGPLFLVEWIFSRFLSLFSCLSYLLKIRYLTAFQAFEA